MSPESRFGRLQARLIPAVLTALGIMLVTAGLLGYTGAVDAGVAVVSPEPSLPLESSPPAPTLPPLTTQPPTPTPSPSPTADSDRVATRVVIPALSIDLPVIVGPSGYPPCDVAMYLKELGQPGQPRATYIYGHAQRGMFLPLLTESQQSNGRRMLGMLVQVYTSDSRLFLYEITEVRRHQTTLDDVIAADHDQMWLQTSEGPNSTYPKLQVVAELLSEEGADPAEALPEPRPRNCRS
jgi:hypothetical protein